MEDQVHGSCKNFLQSQKCNIPLPNNLIKANCIMITKNKSKSMHSKLSLEKNLEIVAKKSGLAKN